MHKRIVWRLCSGRTTLAVLLATAPLAAGLAMPAKPATFQNPTETATSQQNKEPTRNERKTDKLSSGEFHLSRERYEKAVAYSRAGYTLYFVSVAWGILMLWLLLKTRLVARWRDFVTGKSGNWVVQGLMFVPALSLAVGVAQLPIRLYWHRLSLQYQQSVQGWGSWIWDWTKGEFINIVYGVGAALILFAAIRRAPRTWWLYFWMVSVPLVLFFVLIIPWVVDPMFYKFTPLQQTNPQLVTSIERLTERAGEPIPPERMFLMQASEKTNQINAYVAGIGASKRVVIWDNTIKKMTPDEVLSVVGHELGHYLLGHVVQGIALSLLGTLAALFVMYHALQWALKGWGDAWGVREQSDWAALPVLVLIISALTFLSEPIQNGISRSFEHAADVYGLEVTYGIVPNVQETAAHSFQVMGELDLADPNPPKFITFWLYSHPPLADRLKFAHDYDPWGEGKPPKYVK
jgi:Zn-dependent protease with chaperone function